MVDDHEDYQPGEAPAAHKTTHQDGGSDEISVAGLSGETSALAAHKILPAIHHIRFTAAEARAAINNIFGADGKADVDINLDTHKLINVVDPVTDQGGDTKKARDQAITDHTALATAHQDAPGLIETHRLVAAAHHARYTDLEAEAVADAQIATHALVATAHQDAPGLIETHRLVAGAHHSKFTAAEARAAINNIFGADGKADADIDLDGHAAKTPHIVFPAVQVPSANANTLDDYEEGTWTPNKTGFTEAGGGSYTLTGFYVKIGMLVWIQLFINCLGGATIASVGGAVSYLSNLPFPGNATYPSVINCINPYPMVSYGQAILTGDIIYPDVFGPTGASQGVVFSGCYKI